MPSGMRVPGRGRMCQQAGVFSYCFVFARRAILYTPQKLLRKVVSKKKNGPIFIYQLNYCTTDKYVGRVLNSWNIDDVQQ